MTTMTKKNKKGKEEAKDRLLIDLVLSWSVPQIMNQNLYHDKVKQIPDTFPSVQHYLNSFVGPLIEETHADLRSGLTSLRSAPAAGIYRVKTSQKKTGLLTLKAGDKTTDGAYYEPESGDLIAITEVRPKCVDDLNGPKRQYTVAYVQGTKDDDPLKIRIISSKHIDDFERGDVLFAVYLTNLTTNRRIWNALLPGEGGNTRIINAVLDVKPSMEEKCIICYPDETKMVKLRGTLGSFRLNDSQRDAVMDSVAFANCRHQNGVKLLWGPPGTGKTNTIATLGIVLLKMRCRTLACAPTNVAVLGITKCLLSSLAGTLVHGTYGLGDVILLGNGKRMKIDEQEDLHDIFLDYRVRVLAHCFAPVSGWRGNLDKMIGLLEDPQGQYKLYLSGQQKNEDSSESDDDENEEEKKVEMSSSCQEDSNETLKRNIWKKIIAQNIKGNKGAFL